MATVDAPLELEQPDGTRRRVTLDDLRGADGQDGAPGVDGLAWRPVAAAPHGFAFPGPAWPTGVNAIHAMLFNGTANYFDGNASIAAFHLDPADLPDRAGYRKRLRLRAFATVHVASPAYRGEVRLQRIAGYVASPQAGRTPAVSLGAILANIDTGAGAAANANARIVLDEELDYPEAGDVLFTYRHVGAVGANGLVSMHATLDSRLEPIPA